MTIWNPISKIIMSQRFELTQYHCEAACFPLLWKGFEKYIKKEKDFFGLNAFLGFASSYKEKNILWKM